VKTRRAEGRTVEADAHPTPRWLESVRLRAAARLMRERRIGALPVVDEGRVVGILSATDVLAALEKFLGDRLTTIRPLRALSIGEPYDYGFPLPGQGDPL
jgi:hypothetical protein